jgi:hypothetical protein
MMHISLYERARIWVLAGWRNRAVSFKAVVYALVGVVNTTMDYGVFLAAHAVLGRGQHVVLDGRGHRAPGDIMSESRATSSRNARATSSESASQAPHGA